MNRSHAASGVARDWGCSTRSPNSNARSVHPAYSKSTSATRRRAWVWYLLACHPEAEQHLHEELHRTLAGRAPTGDDLSVLPFTTAVAKEALRLYPPTWLTVRKVAAACDLGGYPLVPGQTLLFSNYVLHRDPRWHPDADRFVPQRWLNGTTDDLPRCAYLPFGAGPATAPEPPWPWPSLF